METGGISSTLPAAPFLAWIVPTLALDVDVEVGLVGLRESREYVREYYVKTIEIWNEPVALADKLMEMAGISAIPPFLRVLW